MSSFGCLGLEKRVLGWRCGPPHPFAPLHHHPTQNLDSLELEWRTAKRHRLPESVIENTGGTQETEGSHSVPPPPRPTGLAAGPAACLLACADDVPAAAPTPGPAAAPGGARAAAPAAAAADESIAKMQSIRFEGGRVVRTAYLDDFPFPHYVLLRDAAGLPRALGGLVRRWVDAAAASSS